jgi:sulfur carrier protein ThiS
VIVSVVLHTILQRLPVGEPKGSLQLELPEGATLGEVLHRLEIPIEPDALILVVNHRVATPEAVLSNGDQVDIVPAISGG